MRKGFISSCVRGRQLQSREREAVIPTKEDFDWLLCQMTGFMRTQILAVAASLRLAEHVQGAGRTAEDFAAAQHILTEQTGVSSDARGAHSRPAQSAGRMAYRASYGSEEIGQESIVIMEKLSKTVSFTRVVREGNCSVFEVLGASVEFLVGPQADDEAPCIIRGTMPPGVSVPIHRHKAVEVFFILSGNIEVLIEDGVKMSWVEASAGNLIEIPSKAKHAFRNRSQHPVINLLHTTSEHGRYFQEIGRPATSEESVRPPGPDEIQRLLKTARRYSYWFATPEENASVGITLL